MAPSQVRRSSLQKETLREKLLPGLRYGVLMLSVGLLPSLSLWAQPPVPAQPQTPTQPATQPVTPATQPGQQPPSQVDTGLPPNFELPKDPPPQMELEKALLKPDAATAETEFKRIQSDYKKALRNGELGGEAETLIKNGIEYRVLILSMPSERRKLVYHRETLLRDLRTAASLQPNQPLAETFRTFVMNEVIANASLLLDNQFHVRLNAVLLLGQLNLVEPERKGTIQIPAVPFQGAATPLLEVLNSPDQLQAVKIPAALGLGRIATIRNLPPKLRQDIAHALVDGITDPQSHAWYRMRLIHALGNVELVYDRGVNPKPFLIDTLVKMMLDEKQHYLIRSEAARSLGRVLMDNSINASLVAHEIARLALEMAKAQQANPNAFYWKGCFLNLYLAFRGEHEEERQRNAGLITKVEKSKLGAEHKSLIEGAYQKILPLVILLVSDDSHQGALPADKVTALQSWLNANKPTSNKLAPSLEPITRTNSNATEARPPATAAAGS